MARLLARLRTPPPVIFPFNDDARALLFGGPPLAQMQRDEARAAGFELADVDEDAPLPAGTAALVAADVVFNAAALRALVERSSGGVGGAGLAGGSIVQATVRRDTALWRCSTRLAGFDDVTDANVGPGVGDLRVALWAGALAGQPASSSMVGEFCCVGDEADVVAVDVKPHGPPPHQLLMADVERLLGRPRHWLHVLELSLAALRTGLRARGQGADQRRHGARLFGRDRPQVHPTAWVDNSVLGARTVVEAHASVVDSVVGADVVIADHTVVHGSVIGDRCRTLVDTHLRRVVAMPGSTLSNLDMQDAIFGRDIFLTTSVAFFADGPGQNVVVDGQDSGRPVLSGAIGAGAVLGSRALFRSGVALPAQVLVVARPGEAIGKLDELSLRRSSMRLGDRARDV